METEVNEEDLILTGSQLTALSGDKAVYDQAIERAIVFAKLSPHQKVEVIEALRQGGGGRAVGFLGDGVNDALAIRTADVGFPWIRERRLPKKRRMSSCWKRVSM